MTEFEKYWKYSKLSIQENFETLNMVNNIINKKS